MTTKKQQTPSAKCQKCNTFFHVAIGSNQCPECEGELVYETPSAKSSCCQKYKKKPVVIEAFQYNIIRKGNYRPDWFQDKVSSDDIRTYDSHCEIKTLEGVMRANKGDWIIRGIKGEIYPCKPDIFDATYEPCCISVQSSPDEGEMERLIDDFLKIMTDFPRAWEVCKKGGKREWHHEKCSWRTHQMLCDCAASQAFIYSIDNFVAPFQKIVPYIRSLKSRLDRTEVDLHSYRFDADRMFHALKILSHVDDGQESNGTDVYVRGVASGTIASLSNQYPSSK